MSNKTNKLKKENQEGKVEAWLRDDGIVEFKAVGTLNEQLIEEIKKKINEEIEMIKKLPRKVNNLADLSQLIADPKTGWKSSLKVRKLGVRFLRWNKIRKAAILGNPSSSLIRVAISFVIRMGSLKKAKYFIKKEEAIKWLKQ
jgi:hypothetical protein